MNSGKQKDVDYSIEFYAKTRSEPSFQPNSGDDLNLADIMFGVDGNNNETQMSMWRLIHRHMVSGNIEQQLQEEKQSSLKMLAIKNIVREAIEKIIVPEDDDSETIKWMIKQSRIKQITISLVPKMINQRGGVM